MDRRQPLLDQIVSGLNRSVQPVGCAKILETKQLREWPGMTQYSMTAIAMVTLGQSFDRLEKGEPDGMTASLFRDAAGTALLDKACNRIDEVITEAFNSRTQARSLRFSPGYGRLPLSDQSHFFRRLPAESMSVTLKSNFMMDPLKTVSFAVVPLIPGEPSVRDENMCRGCGHINCSYREENVTLSGVEGHKVKRRSP